MKHLIYVLFFLLTILTGSSLASNFKNWDVKQIGNTKVYIPPNLRQNERYSITLFPSEKLNNLSQADWLTRFVNKDEKNLGTITFRGKISRHEIGVIGTARKFKNATGREFDYISNRYEQIFESQFALYMSQKLDVNTVGIMRINYSNMAIFKRYQYGLAEAGKIMSDFSNNIYLEKKVVARSKEKQRIAEIEKKKSAEKKQKIAAEKRAKALRRTEPNKGLKLSQIEVVLVTNDIDVMIGGYDTTLHLLLKDGWVYKLGSGGVEIPPSDFDADYSKKSESDRWSKWRKNSNGKYEKKTAQGKWIILDGYKGAKGTKNETVNGNYGMHTGSSNFGSSSSYVKLFKNGRFELSSTSLMSSPVLSPYSTISSSSSDKEGTRTAISSSGPGVVAGSSSKKKNGAKNTGTYKIYGYTIEMRHDNGWVRRELFSFIGADKSAIVIDDTYYWISTK